jgi:hypothetical protein
MNAVMRKNGTLASRVPFEDYLQLPGISISRLKNIKRSPKHCRFAMRSPPRTPALQLGTAAHCKVLEPERFAGQFRIWEKRAESDPAKLAPRQGKVWDGFRAAAAADKVEVLTIDEALAAQSIADAVRGDAQAMRYLEEGEPEVTMRWQMQGIECKGRVDWLTRVGGETVLVGLKTTRDCRPFYFGKQAAQLNYAWQWAWYMNGFQTIKSVRPKLVEIVVESAAPHDVAVFNVPDDILLQGEDEYNAALMLYAECEKSGNWPGAVPQETDLILPSWAFPSMDDDLTSIGVE